jgi:hypothetical protein
LRTFWFENKEDTLKQKWIVFYADASIRTVHMISKRINEITYIANRSHRDFFIFLGDLPTPSSNGFCKN